MISTGSSDEGIEIDSEMNEIGESREEIINQDSNVLCELVCSLCDNAFRNEKQFLEHLEIHGIQLRKNNAISNVPINNTEQLLFMQEKEDGFSTPHVVRPFKCCLCGLVFDRVSQLDNHKRSVHHRERSKVCQICGKGFFRQTDLKTHLNIHLGTNRCICEVCGRKFNHMSNLTRHSRTHSGVKPYPCTICGKRFTQINTLARHKVIHKRKSGSMDCCFCDKRYKSASGLKEHLRKSHRFTEKSNSEGNGRTMKRQHYCKICGESFQFVELLRIHETRHRNAETLECKSCNQKFEKMDEIKEHRCRRKKSLSASGIKSRKIKCTEESVQEVIRDKNKLNLSRENESILIQLGEMSEDTKALSQPQENNFTMEFPRLNGLKNFHSNELDDKLSQSTIVSSKKLEEDNQTKETIVYVTTDQLANMNTEQVVDTANHFLHEHLMELAVESSLQTENISSRDCDEETVVSEMLNSWKDIEMPNVNEFEIPEKKISLPCKNISQSIIYIHALKKDGLIFLNENGNLLSNHTPDLTSEKSIDIKHDSGGNKNSSLHTELETVETIKTCENEYGKKHSSDLIENETPSKKLSCNCVSYENTSRNFREQNHKQEPETKGIKTERTRNYFSEENSHENDNSPVETTNPPLTHNMFEELLKNNADNVNTLVGKSSENQEPTLRLVQTENGEQFYELLITNCSDKSENSFELDKISVIENIRAMQNEPVPESLLKLVQLGNGQHVLELMKNTLSDETNKSGETEDIERATSDGRFIRTSVLEDDDDEANGAKNFVQNKSEKVFYLAQNNKDNLIDFFEIETLETQEQNSFNLVSDETMENVSQTNSNNLQILNRNKSSECEESPIDTESCEELFGLIQSNPPRHGEKIKSESKKTKREQDPMVRLVQNEDGAQFFELIRGDLEFDETQDFELVKTNEFNNGQNVHLENIARNSHAESTCTINDTIKLEESEVPRKKRQKSNAKKYNCDVCKKSFSKGYNYRQHIGTHFADQQKFKCKECGTLFAWKSTLNKHMATHRAGGQQKFVCEICPKVYTTLSQVNEHVKRDHLKERNHKCTHCAKSFFKKFDLKIHIRTHTKERPYECRVCYKSFHHQSHIIRHERIHSGERPYACNVCEKTFTQLGSLKNHRQRHQELKIDILDYQMDEDDPLPRTAL